MDQKDKLNEIDAFTEEVEGAIDSLFNPSKKIEIDPLTNEIREIGTDNESSPEPSADLDLQFDQASAQADTSASIEEIPLELEPEPEITPRQAITDQQIWLYNIKEHIMTLEWEVTSKTIDAFAKTLEKPQADLPLNCINIAKLMAEALHVLKFAPSYLLSSILPALKLGFNALDSYITNPNDLQTQYNLESATSALKNVIKEGKEADKIAVTLPPTIEPPKPQPPDSVANQPKVTSKASPKTAVQHHQMTNKKLIDEIKAHLGILKQISEKIALLEALIANRKGLKKLYKLLHGIHTKLESESKKLSTLIGVDYIPVDLEKSLSQSDVTSFKEAMDSHPKKDRAKSDAEMPEELFIAECDTTKLAFLPEEVCCHFKISSRMLKKTETQGRFSLKLLKKWPWSKVSKQVFGELAKLTEKELQILDLPLKNVLGETSSEFSNKKWGIILFKNNKGAVIFVDTRPKLVTPTKDMKCKIISMKNFAK